MSGSFSIGRWFGVPIKLHFSWLLIFLLAWFGFSAGQFPQRFPEWDAPLYWLAGFVTAVLFWVSVLGHELAHATVARMRKVPIRGITLFALGGAAEMERDAESGGDEALITIVGPLSSLLFAAIFFVIELVTAAMLPGVSAIAGVLTVINVSLALFNLIPAFPLDGGRVLRALIWSATNDFMKATRIAVRIGQGFAWLFIGFGVVQMLFFRGGLDNLWIIFIGWFLNNAANGTLQQVSMQELLRGVRAAQMMRQDFAWVPAGTRVEDLVHNYFLQSGRPGLPVIDNNRFVGLVTLTDIKGLDKTKWTSTPVGAIMTPFDKLETVNPDSSAESVLRLLQEKELSQLPVLYEGRLVGLISVSDVLRTIKVRQELNVRGNAHPSQPTTGPIA